MPGEVGSSPSPTRELVRRDGLSSYFYFQRLTPAPLPPLTPKPGSQDPFPSFPAPPPPSRSTEKSYCGNGVFCQMFQHSKSGQGHCECAHACSQTRPKMSACCHQSEEESVSVGAWVCPGVWEGRAHVAPRLLVAMEGSGQERGTPNILLILKSYLRVSVALDFQERQRAPSQPRYRVRPRPEQTETKLSKSKDIISFCLYVLKPTAAKSVVRGRTPACPSRRPVSSNSLQ